MQGARDNYSEHQTQAIRKALVWILPHFEFEFCWEFILKYSIFRGRFVITQLIFLIVTKRANMLEPPTSNFIWTTLKAVASSLTTFRLGWPCPSPIAFSPSPACEATTATRTLQSPIVWKTSIVMPSQRTLIFSQ